MGIPSQPTTAPVVSPLVRLQQLSPELALQAVSDELENKCKAYESELLPVASVDVKVAQKKGRKAWADCEDSDASDKEDEQSTLARDSESQETRSNSSTSKKDNIEASFEVSASLPESADLMESKGVMKADVSSLVPTASADENTVVQLLCKTWRDDNNGLSVAPCMGDDFGPYDMGEHDVFWCKMEKQEDGDTRITPCTDAASCGVEIDASGTPLHSLPLLGAPAKPEAGSYAPTWIYGANWPFCVAPTTLMLSNLPEDLLQEDLIEILDKEDFSGFYDFLYLVADPDSGRSLGCAIVNLTRHEYGLALSAMMHGRASWCGTKSEACKVSWALPMQGLSQLIDYYQELGCKDSPMPEETRPTFFSGGFPSPFPQPQVMTGFYGA